MKKVLWCSLFCALLATFTQAQETQVTSKNAVGYVKVTFVPGYNFVGLNFHGMTSDDGLTDIQDLFDTSTLNGGEDRTVSDSILFWDALAQGYEKAWLFDSGSGHALDGKWIEWNTINLASNKLLVGMGFWYRNLSSSNEEQFIKGEVPTEGSTTNLLGEGYTMCCYAYPVNKQINDLDWTGAHGAEDRANADNLMLWDSETQNYVKAWLFDSGSGHALDGKWIEWNTVNPASNTLVVGQGFWYRSREPVAWSWVQERPFNWP